MATATVAPVVKKKKSKRTVSKGILCVKATYNNTIVTVTDDNGNVLAAASAGSCGFRGSRKNTAYAAQVAAERALTAASQTFGLKSVAARINGVGQGRDASLRAAAGAGIDILSISDITSIRFGGCRPRKAPRK
jgi:small subunit ribosomal protein S11